MFHSADTSSSQPVKPQGEIGVPTQSCVVLWGDWLPRALPPLCAHDTGNLELTETTQGAWLFICSLFRGLEALQKNPIVKAQSLPLQLRFVWAGKDFNHQRPLLLSWGYKAQDEKSSQSKENRSRNSRAHARKWRQSPSTCPEQSTQQLLIPLELNVWKRELSKQRQ